MKMDPAPKPARPRLNPYTKALRRERVFARVRVGASVAEIAREEGLSEQRVRKIISDTLKRQEVDDLPDHALLQLFRLEGALAIAGKAIEGGDLKAIPPYLKVLDHLDLYRKASVRKQAYDDAAREKLFAKINRIAAQMKGKRRKSAVDAPNSEAEATTKPDSDLKP
jgi:predicted transcriptional regulator